MVNRNIENKNIENKNIEKVSQEIKINKSSLIILPIIFLVAGFFWYKTLTSDNDWIRVGGWVVFLRNLPGLIITIFIIFIIIFFIWHNREDIIWT